MEIGVQMLKNLSLFPKGISGVWTASQNLSSLDARGLGFIQDQMFFAYKI